MRVDNLKLSNFRNFSKIEISPCESINIIVGDNAQGKTNLLESIWLFSGAKSFRQGKDADFIKFGEEAANMQIEFTAGLRSQTAEFRYVNNKKEVFLNDIKQESAAKLAGVFCSVVFSPDHLSLVKQGPEKRRKFIDISLCQAFPKYMRVLDNYYRAVKQRNTLLKDISGHSFLLDTLDTWDKCIVEYGSYITNMRSRYIKKLAAVASEAYAGISSGKESFSIIYLAGCGETQSIELDDLKKSFWEALKISRGEDIRQGVTTIGPHRDDMEILIDAMPAKSFGSQGQQRSAILALKLAECGILEEKNSEPPVVLLDDVMSELDAGRRDFLLNQLKDKQVFITCCDSQAVNNLADGRIFEIYKGTVM